jgi:pyruvate dehydrogenase E2 component (dihydrolipoamide acetyltransferase)
MEIVLPKWGLTMSEATIVRWMCSEGDAVGEGDPLVEVETEKANAEVPAPSSGVIVRIVAEVGAIVPVGELLAVLEAPGEPGAGAAMMVGAVPGTGDEPTPASTAAAARRGLETQPDERGRRASPLARRLARELGVDLTGIHGTGPKGLVSEADVRAAAHAAPAGLLRPARTEKLAGMRRAIAAAMSRSLAEAAQLTVTREVGMAGALAVREDARDVATLTDVIVAAVARTLRHHPRLNAHLVGDEIRFFDAVNIGLGVALENGLVTPVIRNASSASLAEIAAQRRDLVDRARAGALRQSELEGGTFTITNLGAYGIDAFTPILNPPEVGILGVGAVKPRPAISAGAVVARDACPLSLTFDHRAVDGAPAALFLADLAELLQDPDRLGEELR